MRALSLLLLLPSLALGQGYPPPGGSGSGITLGAFGSSPDAKGATLSAGVLTLQPADATHPGLVTTGAQTWAGAKKFSGNILGTFATPQLINMSYGANGIQLATGSAAGGEVIFTDVGNNEYGTVSSAGFTVPSGKGFGIADVPGTFGINRSTNTMRFAASGGDFQFSDNSVNQLLLTATVATFPAIVSSGTYMQSSQGYAAPGGTPASQGVQFSGSNVIMNVPVDGAQHIWAAASGLRFAQLSSAGLSTAAAGNPVPVVHAGQTTAAQAMEFGKTAATGGSLAVTFATAFASAPTCTCTHQAAVPLACGITTAANTTSVTFTAGAGTDVINWICIGAK